MLTGSQIRRKFLDYFVQHGHKEVHSSSLVPANDPTLLFTNAGMNQFKDVFLGLETRDYKRATTSQKCVRAGGKHNDLENVGFTNRHHTFFEMLGNFSFGDYFKKDAIAYAWELITSPEWFAIEKDKLYVTIFKGENGVPRDAEAYDLWAAQGVSKDRIFEFGAKDNFWQMGDTGPCGPCSEIHYDMGPAASDQSHTDCAFGCDCGRYVEIWNLVFMQFDRDATGKLNLLPKPSIDTGMGLERVTAVLQGVISNYDTDLFTPLIKRAAELTGTTNTHVGTAAAGRPAEQSSAAEGHKSAASLRVIADHSRATAFLIADGVLPSNEGRGYVLRKIMRRAMRHAWLLGQKQPIVMTEMVIAVQKMMSDVFPELIASGQTSRVVQEEERRFHHTMELGLDRLEGDLQEIQFLSRQFDEGAAQLGKEIWEAEKPDRLHRSKEMLEGRSDPGKIPGTLSGEKAFKLYDTFGLPIDFIQDATRDAGLKFDQSGFDRAMEEQKARARASWKGAAKQTANPAYQQLPKSAFEGYRQTRSNDCEVLAIIHNGQGSQQLNPGDEGEIILDHTPFYAESGGQVGDRGWLYSADHNTVVAEVKGCYSPIQGVRAHQVIEPSKPIRIGDKVDAVVNAEHSRVNHAQPHGHALAPSWAAGSSGQAREAGRIAGRSQPSALRFLAFHWRCRRRTARHRRPDQQRSPPQRKGRSHRERPHRRRYQRIQSDGPVRRKIWRPGPRHQDRRLFHRTLRRHAYQRHRRDRPDQSSERRQRLLRRSARLKPSRAKVRCGISSRTINWRAWSPASSVPPCRKERERMGHPRWRRSRHLPPRR